MSHVYHELGIRTWNNAGVQAATSQNMTVCRKEQVLHLSLSSPHFFLVIHTSSQTTQEVCTDLRGESGMGKQNEICSKGLCMFYFSSSWKLSVALWNKISFAGRKLYNQYVWQALKMWWSGTEQLPIYGIFVSPWQELPILNSFRKMVKNVLEPRGSSRS